MSLTKLLLVAIGLNLYPMGYSGEKNHAQSSEARPVADDYFGTKVTDPYRWMEAGLTDFHFVTFLKAQNQVTESALARFSVARAKLLSRIKAFDSAVPDTIDWARAGDRIFYREIPSSSSDAILRVKESDGTSRTLVDPKDYKSGGKHAAIDYFQPSWSGANVAVGVSLGGSEDSTLYIVDVSTGRVLPDVISRTQYGNPSWRSDEKSFFYFRQQPLSAGAPPTAIYENGRVLVHVLGTDPEKDPPVFGPGLRGSPNVPIAGFSGVSTSADSPYVLAYYSAGTSDSASVYVAREVDATNSDTPWKQILRSSDKLSTVNNPAVLRGTHLYILTTKDSPNGSVLVFDLDRSENPPNTIIAPSDHVIDGIYGARDALYISSRNGVAKSLSRLAYEVGAMPKVIPLPVEGSTFSFEASTDHSGVLFGLQSWIIPPLVYLYDPSLERLVDTGIQPKNPLDLSLFRVKEVQTTSTDGSNVPISIIFRKDTVLDGSHPTLFVGYGAYGIPTDAEFNPSSLPGILAWVERGGVFAVAHVRGGGEYGEGWHLAAQKATKQHTVDDMIATAKYLTSNKYNSPERLAVRGTSAGGIAVGNCIVQHPELFAAAIDNVGVTNMLRFQLTQGGPANIPEFGDVTKPEEFKWLYAISPYHHVKDGTRYPAVLALTGTNDPRVPCWMVAEFVARLQRATSSGRPVLLRVDFDTGHGTLGSNRVQLESAAADEQAFLLWQMGDKEFKFATREHHGKAD